MQVKINTSDTEWIARHGSDPVVHGTDIKGVVYFNVTVEVPAVEHVTFAGANMIRFDLGPDAPRDSSRHAMYPATYLVTDPSQAAMAAMSAAMEPTSGYDHDLHSRVRRA